MPDGYELHDARFPQIAFATSAANGLVQAIGPVPPNKVWTILHAFATNSVGAGGETQYYWFGVSSDLAIYYPITRPVNQLVDNSVAQYFPMLTEGMEIKLFPGQYIAARRAAATAGSTLIIYIRYFETDLPYYKYTEPLNKVVESKMKHGSISRAMATGAVARGGAGFVPHGGVPHGGGGGTSEPV
jgi:hypothetical protein